MSYRLVSNAELEIAENSMRSLRSAVNGAKPGAVGTQARGQVKVLSAVVNTASIAIDVLRSDIHNPRALALVSEYSRIEKTAREIVEDLSNGASYVGPRRGVMSTAEKSRFISEHGAEKFFALPS